MYCILLLQAVIGQRRGLSSIDAQQANLLYRDECAKREGGLETLIHVYLI